MGALLTRNTRNEAGIFEVFSGAENDEIVMSRRDRENKSWRPELKALVDTELDEPPIATITFKYRCRGKS